MRRIAALLLLIALLAGTAAAVDAQSSGLRGVDWPAVVAADPHVTFQPGNSTMNPELFGQPISVTLGEMTAGGAPVYGEIEYGDLDGDGAEEAMIPLFSTGAAGRYLGFLLFHEGVTAPRLVAIEGGPNVVAHIDGTTLVISRPLYAEGDSLCCPSAVQVSTYVLSGDQLVPV